MDLLPNRNVARAGLALAAIGVVHLIVLGKDALPYMQGWGGLEQWTFEHWRAFAAQPREILESGAAFWTTVGSSAVPTIVLGLLLRHLALAGVAVPIFVGWMLAGWLAVASLIVEPSGFPVGLAVAVWLIAALRRQADSTGVPAIPGSQSGWRLS